MRAELFERHSVEVDERTAKVGGAFYYDPLRSYGPVPLKWAKEVLETQENPVLLDVGASTGCFTLLTVFIQTLRVYAFEPVWHVRQILEANVDLNNVRDRVTVSPLGICSYTGTGVLHEVSDPGGSGCSMVNGKPYDGKECTRSTIMVSSLDDYCETHDIKPTMIKIDVEGSEKFVLRGAAKTIEKYHPVIIVEYEPLNTAQYGYKPWAIARMLEKWGYVYHNPEGLDLLAVYQGVPK